MRAFPLHIAVIATLVVAPLAARAAAPERGETAAGAHKATSDADGFIPPMRGTPDGRISGATRGIGGSPVVVTTTVDDTAPDVAQPKSRTAPPHAGKVAR